MNVVSVTGITGGVGATTLVAQLAFALRARGNRVIAFDLSPHNMLRLHFGMPWAEGVGLVPHVLSGKPWNESAYRCENMVEFLPFGKCSEHEVAAFYRMLDKNPSWLAERLAELETDDNTYVLIDSPRSGHGLRAQAHALSNLILIVLEADTQAYAVLDQAQTSLSLTDADMAVLLLNGFDPTRTLDCDIAKLLRHTHAASLCPVTIHRDESVREALSSKRSLNEYAPYSQAESDFSTLTTWLIAWLANSPSSLR